MARTTRSGRTTGGSPKGKGKGRAPFGAGVQKLAKAARELLKRQNQAAALAMAAKRRQAAPSSSEGKKKAGIPKGYKYKPGAFGKAQACTDKLRDRLKYKDRFRQYKKTSQRYKTCGRLGAKSTTQKASKDKTTASSEPVRRSRRQAGMPAAEV